MPQRTINGIPTDVDSFDGMPIVGIMEADTPSEEAGDFTITEGSLSFGILMDADWTATITTGGETIAWTVDDPRTFSRTAQPGNVLPAYSFDVSAGSAKVFVANP